MKLEFITPLDREPGTIVSLLNRCYADLLSSTSSHWESEQASWEKYDQMVYSHPETIGACIFLSRLNGMIVGFGSWDPRQRPRYGIVGHNCILPKFRGKRLGRQQVQEILRRFRKMKNTMKKVLFVCTYNGARSRIAEEFVKLLAAGKIETHSSCFETGKIGPLPVNVMREIGIDLPVETPKSVFKRYKDGEFYDYVIPICNEATTEQCPIFKTSVDAMYAKDAERISWSIPDFKSIMGTDDEKRIEARKIRDKIKSEVISFLAQIGYYSETA